MWTTTSEPLPLFCGGQGPLGLYLHVPFCASRCPYCAFYSQVGADEEAYLSGLLTQLDFFTRRLTCPLTTLYVGGGTPSLLSIPAWRSLLSALRPLVTASCVEWTVEANPESFSQALAELWRDAGVTRVSFGVQTLDEGLSRRLGRRHGPADVDRALALALERGFRVSCDLMFGLPGGTARGFRADCRSLIDRGVTHLSLYQLTLEPGTVWGRRPPQLSDGATAYRWAQWALPRMGLAQYEVASFAVPGQESRHNGLYWDGSDVVPLGPSAWGYWQGTRVANAPTMELWLRSLERPGTFWSLERKNRRAAAGEAVILATRRSEGLDRKAFARAYGEDMNQRLEGVARRWPGDCFQLTEERLRLTPRGLRVANALWCDLIEMGNDCERHL